MERMLKQTERFETKIIFDHIDTAKLQQHPFYLKGDNGEYTCDALIIATGASAKYLGLASEEAYKGKGVSACATCDGIFLPQSKSRCDRRRQYALEESLYLANIASHVTVVHRRDKFRGEKILAERLHNAPKMAM